jgi:ketosteroid isomerase-like protein
LKGETWKVDERYEINAARTRMRESYRNADVEQILAAFADDFTDMRFEQPNFYGVDAITILRARLQKLFRQYEVEMTPIILDITIASHLAIECGWQRWTLRPKSGGPMETMRNRYVDVWRQASSWQIVLHMDNPDQKPELVENILLGLGAGPSRQDSHNR